MTHKSLKQHEYNFQRRLGSRSNFRPCRKNMHIKSFYMCTCAHDTFNICLPLCFPVSTNGTCYILTSRCHLPWCFNSATFHGVMYCNGYCYWLKLLFAYRSFTHDVGTYLYSDGAPFNFQSYNPLFKVWVTPLCIKIWKNKNQNLDFDRIWSKRRKQVKSLVVKYLHVV